MLPDGRYAVVISEKRGRARCYFPNRRTARGKSLGRITVVDNPRWSHPNESVMLRPDGNFEMFGRAAVVMIWHQRRARSPYVALRAGDLFRHRRDAAAP